MPVRDLRDVDKTVYPGNYSCESAERRHADNFRFDDALNGVIPAQNLPGVVLRLFIAEGYLSFFVVKRLYVDLDFVADVEDVGRMLYALP